MDKFPFLSVITPSYNQGAYIEKTILSVKNQNYDHFEHIIIDGGSKDNTLRVLKKYPHLKWVSGKDNGQSSALNKGFRLAKGSIIGWINSDDTYTSNTFKHVVSFLEKHKNVDLIYSDCNFIDKNDNLIGVWKTHKFNYFFNLNYAQMIPQPTIFFRRSVLDKIGYLDENLNYALDYDFLIRISKKCRISRVADKVFANFRLHSSSKTILQRVCFESEVKLIRKRSGAIVPYILIKLVQFVLAFIKKRY